MKTYERCLLCPSGWQKLTNQTVTCAISRACTHWQKAKLLLSLLKTVHRNCKVYNNKIPENNPNTRVCVCVCVCVIHSVVSNSLQPHKLQPSRILSVCEISQARILKWRAISFSRDLPEPESEPRSPALQADSLPPEPPGKPKYPCSNMEIICVIHTQQNAIEK